MSVIQSIYVALFGRPADPGGLAYWTQVTNNGADLSVMLDTLPNLPEYQARFAGLTNEQIVQSIYTQLFGRDAEPEGLAYFTEQLASGAKNLGNIAVTILQSAQGTDAQEIEAKVSAADLFTASLDTEEEIAAYNGADAAAAAKKFLDAVNKDNPATQESVDAAVEHVVTGEEPGEGGEPNEPGPVDPGPVDPTPPTQKELLLAWQTRQNDAYQQEGNQNEDVNTDGVELANAYVAYLKAGNGPILDIVHHDDGRQQTFHDNVLGHIIELHFGEDAWRPVRDVRTDDAKAFSSRPWSGGYDDDSDADGYQPDAAYYAAAKWDVLNNVSRPDLHKEVVNLTDGHSETGLYWVKDRAELDSIETVIDPTNAGNTVVSFNINEDGVQTGSNRYQGAWLSPVEAEQAGPAKGYNLAQDASVSFKFYIDPNWTEDDSSQVSGVWITLNKPEDATNNSRIWINAEYIDQEGAGIIPHQGPVDLDYTAGEQVAAGFTGFRFWSSGSGWDKYVAYEETGWVTIEYRQEGGSHNLYLEGQHIYTAAEGSIPDGSVIESLIFNSQNFGQDENYLYDDIKLAGVSLNPDLM